MDRRQKRAIRNYVIAVLVFAAIIGFLFSGAAYYLLLLGLFPILLGMDQVIAWMWREGEKLSRSSKKSEN